MSNVSTNNITYKLWNKIELLQIQDTKQAHYNLKWSAVNIFLKMAFELKSIKPDLGKERDLLGWGYNKNRIAKNYFTLRIHVSQAAILPIASVHPKG